MDSHLELHPNPRSGQQCRSSQQNFQQKQEKTHFQGHFAAQFLDRFSAPKIGTSYKSGTRNGGQKTAPKLGPHFRSFGCTFLVPDSHFLAVASTLAEQLARSDEVALLITLDETSIALNHDGQKGVVSKSIDKDSI